MIFLSFLIFSVQCEYGTNVNNKNIELVLSPILIQAYDGKTLNVESSCGSKATFPVTKNIKSILTLPNCNQTTSDFIHITIGGDSNRCNQYGLTRKDMQVTIATEKEYAQGQAERQNENASLVAAAQKKKENLQHCNAENEQQMREAIQHGQKPPTPKDCAKLFPQ